MRRRSFFIVLIGMLLIALPSCLTVEKKEYRFEFSGKESGVLTIKYVNIMSVIDDDGDVEADFNELINEYLQGDLIENNFRFSKILSKRLFEEKGVLCGEVKLEFTELTAAHLFQYEEDGPIMMSLNTGAGMEEYASSNGNYGGEIMPIVFWSDEKSCLDHITNITKPDHTSISLLDKFKEWEASLSE